MARVAIVTDTSSDLLPERAAAAGIRLVPLTVSFGDADVRRGDRTQQRGLLRTADRTRCAVPQDRGAESG